MHEFPTLFAKLIQFVVQLVVLRGNNLVLPLLIRCLRDRGCTQRHNRGEPDNEDRETGSTPPEQEGTSHPVRGVNEDEDTVDKDTVDEDTVIVSHPGADVVSAGIAGRESGQSAG